MSLLVYVFLFRYCSEKLGNCVSQNHVSFNLLSLAVATIYPAPVLFWLIKMMHSFKKLYKGHQNQPLSFCQVSHIKRLPERGYFMELR